MVDSAIDQGAKESLAIDNIKTIGGASAFYAVQQMADSIASQRRSALAQARLDQIAEAELADKNAHTKRMDGYAELAFANAARGIGDMTNPDTPADAVAAQKMLTGNDLGQQMLQFNSVIADQKAEIAALITLVQQLVKASQSTPPETATNPIPNKV